MNLQAVDTIRKWLKTCLDNHAKCRRKESAFVPRRLVHITGQNISSMPCNPLVAVQFTGPPSLRLIEPHDPVPYTALSYCWGTNSQYWVTTTKHTIERHKERINPLTLPRTIQDAILISYLLGIQYIWVDALCITQDDKEDWKVEAAKMGDVYSFARLVLSANVTNDCTMPTAGIQMFGVGYQSLLSLNGSFDAVAPGVRWKEHLGDPTFPMPHNFSAQDGVILRMANLHAKIGQTGCQPLNMRGWTLQESLLGRRMLTLSPFECVWTCDESLNCECGYNQLVLANQLDAPGKGYVWESFSQCRPYQRIRRTYVEGRVTEDTPTIDVIHTSWHHIVTDYTKREITVEKDKLVAISGLAHIFGKVVSLLSQDSRQTEDLEPYLAGIWKANLQNDLLWMAERFPRQVAIPLVLGNDAEIGSTNASGGHQQQQLVDEAVQADIAPLKHLYDRPAKPSTYRAPTWSWASSNLGISWLLDETRWDIECRGAEYTATTTPYVTLVESCVVAEPGLYGSVTLGFISVRGPLVAVHRRCVPISSRDAVDFKALSTPQTLLQSLSSSSDKFLKGLISKSISAGKYSFVRSARGFTYEYFSDEEFEASPVQQQSEYDCLFSRRGNRQCLDDACGCKSGWAGEMFWCLRVSRVVLREESRPARFVDGWLVLQRSEAAEDAFERVGVGYHDSLALEAGGFRLFDDAVQTTVTLV